MAERIGINDWSALLAKTRQALTGLGVIDLEELAALAVKMSRANGSPLGEVARDGLAKEHRLLRELLLATDKNLEVMRRLRDDGERAGGNERARWAR